MARNANGLRKRRVASPAGDAATSSSDSDAADRMSGFQLSDLRYKRVGSVLLLMIVCVGYAHLHYKLVSTVHENHVRFSYLSTLERELFFRTEMGFYYSFFKQIIEAPTFINGFGSLLRDNISEHPVTINSLERFNLYPEVFVAGAYRMYKSYAESMNWKIMECYQINRGDTMPPITSCEGLGEPAFFYCEAVFLLAGVTMLALTMLGYLAGGGSVAAGVVVGAAYFFNHRECTRVQWTPPLRESFAFPLLMVQQTALVLTLKKVSTLRVVFLAVATLAFMLPWQFAQFALLTQVYAVAGAYLLNMLSAKHVQRIVIALSAAHVANFCMQFGNDMLLTGFFQAALVAVFAMTTADRLLIRLSGPLRLLLGSISLLTVTLVARFAMRSLFGGSDDAHVSDILRSKFSDFKTFDTQLYTCSAEFDFYDVSSFAELTKTVLIPTVIIAVFLTLYRLSDADTRPQIGAVGVYLLLQLAAFTVMAMLIMRLKLFFTPQMCISAGLLFHPSVFPQVRTLFGRRLPDADWVRRGTAAVLLAMMAVKGYSNLHDEISSTGEFSNWGQEQLVTWIKGNTKPTEAFGGPMPTMATVRLCTWRPVVNHPHYEDAGLRKRTRDVYSIYSRREFKDVWDVYRKLNVTWMLFEEAWCHKEYRSGCSMPELFDIEDPQRSGRPALCDILIENNNAGAPYFTKHYEVEGSHIFKVWDGES